jgi:hypothetical protein
MNPTEQIEELERKKLAMAKCEYLELDEEVKRMQQQCSKNIHKLRKMHAPHTLPRRNWAAGVSGGARQSPARSAKLWGAGARRQHNSQATVCDRGDHTTPCGVGRQLQF